MPATIAGKGTFGPTGDIYVRSRSVYPRCVQSVQVGLDLSSEDLLEDSYAFYREAVRELEEGVREAKAMKLRDSAEKAWNAVV